MGLFVHAQTCCHIVNRQLNVPFVSYDSVQRDPRLETFASPSRLRHHPKVSSVIGLRPLWPRFERATLTVFLQPGVTGAANHTVLLSEAGFEAGLDGDWLHAKFFLPTVDIDTSDGSPLHETLCDMLLREWGIEAFDMIPRLAAARPGVLHFATNLPPSDDVVHYISKRGFDLVDNYEVSKPTTESRARIHPLGAPDSERLKLLSVVDLIRLLEVHERHAAGPDSLPLPSAVVNPADLHVIALVASRLPEWIADLPPPVVPGRPGRQGPPPSLLSQPLSLALLAVGDEISDPAEWVSGPLRPGELTFIDGADRSQWQVVSKIGSRGELIDWVLSGPSHLLAGLGITGRGLYSLRPFRGPGRRGVTDSAGDVIGTYTGLVIAGPFSSLLTAAARDAGTRLATTGRQHLLWIRRAHNWYIIDGNTGGVPPLPLMNDGRGRVPNNTRFTEAGKVRATRRILPAPLKSATCLEDLGPSELLAGYGGDFWNVHDWLHSLSSPSPSPAETALALCLTASAPPEAEAGPSHLPPPSVPAELPNSAAADLDDLASTYAHVDLSAEQPPLRHPGPLARGSAARRIQIAFRRRLAAERPPGIGAVATGGATPPSSDAPDCSAQRNSVTTSPIVDSGACDGVTVFTQDNSYFIESIIRKLAAAPPATSTAHAFSTDPGAAGGPVSSLPDSTEGASDGSADSSPPSFESPQVVDCLDALRGPMLFVDAEFRSPATAVGDGKERVSATRATICQDTGSALTIIGESVAEWLREEHSDCMQVVDYRQYVHRAHDTQVGGVGGVCLITARANITLYIAGRRFLIKHAVVLRGFEGILLGNDFNHGARSVIDYAKELTCFDHPSGRFCTPFTTVRRPLNQPPPPADAATASAVVDTVIPTSILLAAPLAPAMRKLAFAPRNVSVPAHCLEHLIYVQVPSSIPVGSQVLLDRLPDDVRSHQHLHVIVSAGVSRVLPNRMVPLTVLNPNKFKVTIPELTALATFEIWEGTETPPEFTADEVFDAVNLGDDVKGNPTRERLVRKLLEKHRSSFRSAPGYTHAVKHTIETPSLVPPYGTGTVPPPRARVKPENNEQRAALKAEIDKRMANNLVSPSRSPFCSRPMLVKKSDGTWRMVVDLRSINTVTTKDHYPLPNLTDNLSRCNGTWFTVLDLLSGFDQVELDEASKAKTAFGTSFGLFQFERMTMGLTGAPATFQRLVDAVLSGLPPTLALSYIDDIVIKTDSEEFEDHIRDVDTVLTRLFEAGLSIKAKKMHIGCRSVVYLGYEVSREGIRPDPSRTKPILDMPVDKITANTKSAGSFLGMVGFYRNFIPHFSEVASPFYELTAKSCDTRAVLGSLRIRCSIALLKNCLSGSTLMNRPDPSKPFFIAVDAATMHGCGGTLYQLDDDGSELLVSCFSHRFSDEEKSWNTHELEGYGLFLAVTKYFDSYIGDASFTVYVDHAALQWLMTSNRELHNKKVRDWIERLQSYDMQIIHRPGREHVAPDALSRILFVDCWLHKPGSFDTWPGLSAPAPPSPFSFASGSPFGIPGGVGGVRRISFRNPRNRSLASLHALPLALHLLLHGSTPLSRTHAAYLHCHLRSHRLRRLVCPSHPQPPTHAAGRREREERGQAAAQNLPQRANGTDVNGGDIQEGADGMEGASGEKERERGAIAEAGDGARG